MRPRRYRNSWLAGKRDEARKLVPREIVLKTNLVGTDDMIRERIRANRDAGVTTLGVSTGLAPAANGGFGAPTLEQRIETLGRLMDLVNEVNAESGGDGAG